MKPFGEDWDEGEFPLAYLITIRTYGTWLHGDERLSVDRRAGINVFGTPKVEADRELLIASAANMTARPFVFNDRQRVVVDCEMRSLCKYRKYGLYALDVRTNHAHIVLSASAKPEGIADDLKRYSTKRLRREGLVGDDERIWARGRSRRYLWKHDDVDRAVNYVLYCQSDEPFE